MQVAKSDPLTGAEIVMRALEEEGVDTVFGFPGGAVLFLYDALYACSGLRHILVRHEQGAAHAADAYARATGKPGVCFATSGPGATNLVTGIANAYMDSVPMVAFTGQVGLDFLGRDSFQEADITGITLPITKHNFLVKDVDDLARITHEAFHIATTGRPGPVLIDLPKDVTAAKADFRWPPKMQLPGYRVPKNGHGVNVPQWVEVLSQAKRPVIYAGGGVITSGASSELLRLAEKCQIPVTTTLLGKGSFPEHHPLSLGMLGMHGTAYANYAVTKCDLLIALGARFDDRVTGCLESFAPSAQVIHVDIDPAEIGKNVLVQIPVVGDVRQVLATVLPALPELKHQAWLAQVQEWKQKYPLSYERSDTQIKPQQVIEAISEMADDQTIVCTDVGQHQMWAAQYYRARQPRSFISSGGLGTMGFGLPAGIGAQVGRPDANVWVMAGDGSLQMTIQELATITQHDLPVKIAIIDNGYLGMVRQWQELFCAKRYSHTRITGPDYVKLAEAYGIPGYRIEDPGQVRDALEQAKAVDGPVLLDFVVCCEENVFPMVPPGGSLTEMLGNGR